MWSLNTADQMFHYRRQVIPLANHTHNTHKLVLGSVWQILLDSHNLLSYFTLTYHVHMVLYGLSKFTPGQKNQMPNPPTHYSTALSYTGHTGTIYHHTLPCVKVSCSVVQTTSFNTVHKAVKHCRHVTHAIVHDCMGIVAEVVMKALIL